MTSRPEKQSEAHFGSLYWRSAPVLPEKLGSPSPEALDSSEFRLLADNIPTLCWIANGDGYIVWYNRRWHEYCGTQPEQMEGWGWQSVHDPNVLPQVMERWTHSVATGKPFEMVFPLRGADGNFRPFLTRVQPVRDASGAVVRWFGTNTDVSAQIEAETSLRESEQRFREMADSAPAPVWVTTDHGLEFANLALAEFTGVPREALRGEVWRSLFHPDDLGHFSEIRRDAWSSGRPYEVEVRARRADGEWRWLKISSRPRLSGDGGFHGYVGMAVDVTETRRVEAELREETRNLETLNSTGAAIAGELDLRNVVQTVTDAGVSLTGAQFGAFFYNVLDEAGESYMLYTLSGAQRSDFDRFGMPRNTAVFHPTFSGQGTIRSEDITQDPRYGKSGPHYGMPKGHLPVRSYLAVPVISRSAEVIGGLFFGHPEAGRFTERHERLVTGIAAQAAIAIDNARLYEASQGEIAERRRAEERLQDLNETLERRIEHALSEREKAEEALRQSQKMEAIGKLTGGVAHDFNNLLTVIRSSVDLLRRSDLPEEKRSRYLNAIGDTADRAAKLTSQLLAFARRHPLKAEVFDLAEHARAVKDILQTTVGPRVQLAIEIECEECLIEADPHQLETALINMAVNARDAMDGEGRLSISIRRVDDEPGSSGTGGATVELTMSDTGDGIPDERIGRVFEPFFTTKEVGKGTGLGLSQVYGFVTQSGGQIHVESQVGRGTTFRIALPVSQKHPTKAEEHVAEDGGIASGACILVVEDNQEVGEFAAQLLQELGYKTVWVPNAGAALKELSENPDRFDLVFTDIVMPGGMNGLELANSVRQQYPNLPVVLTSGYSEALLEGEGADFPLLRKPYSVEALAQLIKREPSAQAS